YKDSNKHPLYNIHGYAKVFGGSLPAMIWAKFMRYAEAELPVVGFPAPPPVRSATIPNVVGRHVADAQKALQAAGFSVQLNVVKSAKAVGTVLNETPKAGTSADVGTLITLTVSGNPAPSGTPSPSPSPT
ncbi:MAG TPA: PASTA domain-containing protein, partial [Actinomycetota bacterium]|nr:PASTA domain-containing protein [Actinomycetota bacterium]